MNKTSIYYIATALLFATFACEDDNSDTSVPVEMDKQFVLSASDGGLFEVNAGQVASTKGSTASIKSYGQKMLDDHTAISQELMTLAEAANVDLPTTLSKEKQQELHTLSEFSGIEFDTTYIQMMVLSHEESIKLYETQATTGRNVDLKSFAADKLPRLREHLEMARSMKDSVQ